MTETVKTSDGQGRQVKVWDLFIRCFHWTLVLGFATAYISGEEFASELHVLVGYGLCALIAARIYWGFTGSQYARFRSFLFPLSEILAYVRSALSGHPNHYYGHNPAGALMVFALLATLATLLVTGLLTLGVIDFEGPLVFLGNAVSDDTAYAIRHLHEFFASAALILVALHLLGVVGGSIQHKENLVRAMITGNKDVPSGSASHNQHKEN